MFSHKIYKFANICIDKNGLIFFSNQSTKRVIAFHDYPPDLATSNNLGISIDNTDYPRSSQSFFSTIITELCICVYIIKGIKVDSLLRIRGFQNQDYWFPKNVLMIFQWRNDDVSAVYYSPSSHTVPAKFSTSVCLLASISCNIDEISSKGTVLIKSLDISSIVSVLLIPTFFARSTPSPLSSSTILIA